MNSNVSFYCDDVTWFAQLNTYFAVHDVIPAQQLHILYSGMPPVLARSLRNLIMEPSPDVTYSSLNAEV